MLAGKAFVLLLTFYLLYLTIFTAPDTFLTWEVILRNMLQSELRVLFILVALLIPVNWGIEAMKWQLLGSKIEPISYLRAYRSVMVGLTLGFITPNKLGDYAGRVLELHSDQRLQGIGAVFMGRFCQLVATVLAGSVGFLYFIFTFYWQSYPGVSMSVVVLLVILCIGLLLLLFHARAMVALVASIKPLRKLVPYIAVIRNYTSREVSRLLLLSLVRYGVFMAQFILLLVMFEVKLNLWQYISGVSGTFFLKSVVPSVSLLSDLGVRELSAMYLFGLLGQERLQVLSASLSLWLLNILVPSALGLIFVLRLRLNRKGAAA